MNFRSTLLLPNFQTYTQCQPSSIAVGKFLLLVFMAMVAKKICQMFTEKAYLAFDCKYVSWSLPLSKLGHLSPPSACSLSSRGNLWHPAVRTGVRTPGSNCWQGIGSKNIPTGNRQKVLLNYLWNVIRITTRKLKQYLLSRFNFCVNSQTPYASKRKRHKPHFLPHMVTLAPNSSKLPAEEKSPLPSRPIAETALK